MPLPSGSALDREHTGAGAPSYQTPGNSLHGASPPSLNARERGRRNSLGTPLISPSPNAIRRRRDSLGASVDTPLTNGNRRPELGRTDGPRQQMRSARRREPSVPMSQVDDPDVGPSLQPDQHSPCLAPLRAIVERLSPPASARRADASLW